MTTSPGAPQNENTYVVDAESATEMARLLEQDRIVTQAMGGLFPERLDLSGVHTILDLACGPGGWVLEVARQYPEIEVSGVDISRTMVEYARAHARARGFDNAQFEVMDVLKPLDFLNNSFDLVNARTLIGFISPQTWPALLREAFRVCRPGGILRLTEWEIPLTNSPALQKIDAMFLQALYLAGRSFSPDGRNFGIAPMLGQLLHDAGFKNIQKMAHAIDFSAGTEAREGFYQDFMIGFQLVQPFLTRMNLVTKEEFDLLYRQMLAEMLADDFCAITFSLTAWGRKP